MTQPPDMEAFLRTLEQLPPHSGVVFRGCGARSHEQWPSRALVTQGLISASRDPRVATENFTTEAVYAIVSRKGRAIEQFSAAVEQREVVFLPGTVFTLVTRVRFGDLGVTVVEEFDPSDAHPEGRDLQELAGEIARAIGAAELREVVDPPTPGKFVGDIT